MLLEIGDAPSGLVNVLPGASPRTGDSTPQRNRDFRQFARFDHVRKFNDVVFVCEVKTYRAPHH